MNQMADVKIGDSTTPVTIHLKPVPSDTLNLTLTIKCDKDVAKLPKQPHIVINMPDVKVMQSLTVNAEGDETSNNSNFGGNIIQSVRSGVVASMTSMFGNVGNNGRVWINGKEVTNGNNRTTKSPSITVLCGTVEGDVITDYGNVDCGDVSGSVKTMSGEVVCGDVHGNVSTMSGPITADQIGGDASTMSGTVRQRMQRKRKRANIVNLDESSAEEDDEPLPKRAKK